MNYFKCSTAIIVEAHNTEEAIALFVDKLNNDYSLELDVHVEVFDPELDSL